MVKNFFAKAANDGAMSSLREVLIEFYPVGAYVKVSAVDPVSLTEVSIVGDPSVGEEALKRQVVRKLEFVLARRQGAAGR